jgi:hypothetical protein
MQKEIPSKKEVQQVYEITTQNLHFQVENEEMYGRTMDSILEKECMSDVVVIVKA